MLLMLIVAFNLGGCVSEELEDDVLNYEPEEVVELSKLILTSNKRVINADGYETVSFSIKGYDKNDNVMSVSGAKLYKNGIEQSGMTFNSSIVGSYSFVVKVGNVMSNSVIINVEPDGSEKLLILKNSIDELFIENEMDYSKTVDLYNCYKEILGAYNSETVLAKYLELKELFIKTNNLELKNYANSKEFESNLFFMIVKYSIDNGGYFDKSSVILRGFTNVNSTLKLSLEKRDTEDKHVIKTLSYFNKSNSDELYKIDYSGFYINAKNRFGGYVGEKRVFWLRIYIKSGEVSMLTI